MKIEDLDIFYDFDFYEMTDEERTYTLSAADALVRCINKYGSVHLDYMSEISGIHKAELISCLTGKAIFQNPSLFLDCDEWNDSDGWVLSSQYLCGNILDKLSVAKEVDRKLGHFDKNISALEKLVPEKVDSTSIHISLGATWIPCYIYEEFIASLLNLNKNHVSVTYNREMAIYKIETNRSEMLKGSVLNNYTFGTPDMSALRIVEATLNARTVKVFDYKYCLNSKGNYGYEAVLNQQKTIAAQAKQNLIINAFDNYIHADKYRLDNLCEIYNEHFVGYTFSPFDGSFLTFEDLNPDIVLRRHQKNSVARMLLSDNNLLLSHDVGTGKTYEMICGAHELYRTGISKKNLMVVPNSVLNSFEKAHHLLYPDDKILVVSPKDFAIAKRDKVLDEIRTGDYTAIYMAFSSFDLVVMSKEYWIDKKERRIRELHKAAENSMNKAETNMLKAEAKELSKSLEKYKKEAVNTEWQTFDKLGIDTIFIDEAHNYKNIKLSSRADNITGLNSSGSKKCIECFEKAHYCHRLIMATGTPLTNSIADLFIFQKYLQPEELEYRGVDTVDTWINSFGQRETNYEVSVDSRHLKLTTRFLRYNNLPELMAMFSQVCDFYSEKDKTGIPKFNGHTDVVVPYSEWQKLYIDDLSMRADAVYAHAVDRSEDNLLKITTDGRLCALDIRLADKELYDENNPEYTKTEACADKITAIYERYPDTCQLVFSDIGTPKAAFNVYDELKKILIAKGIPASRVAFIHDAAGDAQKAALFSKMNKGEVSVCIGSTAKLGTGVNVQERLIALHHLDCPWKPADLIQREGRILRQGNTCEEVFIFHYITKGTFDSFSWQVLEKKARFLESFMSGIATEREADEIDATVLRYSEIKAIAIGNELIKKRVETSNKLERARIAFRSRQKELLDLREVLKKTPVYITNLDRLIDITGKDIELYSANKSAVPNEERLAFGEELCEALAANDKASEERRFDNYQGFDIFLPVGMETEKPYIKVRSENGGMYDVDIDITKPMGCSKRIDYQLEHLSDKLNTFRERRILAEKRINDARENINKGNPYEAEIDMIKQELDDIDCKIKEKEEAETAERKAKADVT